MNELNNDLISRKALIEAVEDMYEYAEIGEVLDVIKKAPIVSPSLIVKDMTEEDIKNFAVIYQRATSKGLILEPERPRGKWEEDWREDLDVMSKKGWRCSFCKYRTTYGKSNFCMNCGADMRTEGEP